MRLGSAPALAAAPGAAAGVFFLGLRLGHQEVLAGFLGGGALGEVGVLYATAAWLSAHRDRDRARRFSDVRTPGRSGDAYDAILTALHACRDPDVLSAPPVGSGRRRWSGWPR